MIKIINGKSFEMTQEEISEIEAMQPPIETVDDYKQQLVDLQSKVEELSVKINSLENEV